MSVSRTFPAGGDRGTSTPRATAALLEAARATPSKEVFEHGGR
ncbi:hypothetical protein ACWGLP_18815 [Streptomyces lydicus]